MARVTEFLGVCVKAFSVKCHQTVRWTAWHATDKVWDCGKTPPLLPETKLPELRFTCMISVDDKPRGKKRAWETPKHTLTRHLIYWDHKTAYASLTTDWKQTNLESYPPAHGENISREPGQGSSAFIQEYYCGCTLTATWGGWGWRGGSTWNGILELKHWNNGLLKWLKYVLCCLLLLYR